MKIGQFATQLSCIQQQKRLDVIANNIANVNTPGFKKDGMFFRDFIMQTSQTQWDQGALRETGQSLDVALVGDGFLKVKTDDGVAYTRAGNLTVAKDGILVTQSGHAVLGATGPVQVKDSDITIREDGQIFDKNNQLLGQIELVQFPKDVHLLKVKEGCYEPEDPEAQTTKAEGCTIKQGALESANFSLVEEMTRMVDALRMFEAYQKSIDTSTQDLDGQLITKLGSA